MPRVSVVSAFGVFSGDTLALALAKSRLAVTIATGREAAAEDAAAVTVLAGTEALARTKRLAEAFEHPLFGSGYSNAEAADAARTFMRIHD